MESIAVTKMAATFMYERKGRILSIQGEGMNARIAPNLFSWKNIPENLAVRTTPERNAYDELCDHIERHMDEGGEIINFRGIVNDGRLHVSEKSGMLIKKANILVFFE